MILRQNVEEMLGIITVVIEKVMNLVKGLPLNNLLVGVVVLIVAAWITYYLAERAISKKENNRLYIQIELIKRELKINDDALSEFISYVDEMNKMEKALEFPLFFMKQFLINTFDGLQKIKNNYAHMIPLISEKPTQIYILMQKLEELGKEIEKEESKYCANEYLDEKRKQKLSKLIEEKEQCIEKLKVLKDKDIYKEFSCLQMQLEQLIIGDVFDKMDRQEDNFVVAKYIYNRIKTFNEKEDKTKEDVISLYKDLAIFEISSDVVKDGRFDQDEFDLNYKVFNKPEGMQKKLYELCEKYYKWVTLKEQVSNYKFTFEDKRWKEVSSDFVLINDRELYISLVELYERFYIDIGDNYKEKYDYSMIQHNEIQKIMDQLAQHEVKLKRRCK